MTTPGVQGDLVLQFSRDVDDSVANATQLQLYTASGKNANPSGLGVRQGPSVFKWNMVFGALAAGAPGTWLFTASNPILALDGGAFSAGTYPWT